MGLFDDFSRFLETRLEEFLRNHPHLELQALDEQLREQEAETLRLITEFRAREKQLQQEILSTAQEVQRWHARVEKAKAAGRTDLATAAEAREASLLRQGNQLWGQMKGIQARIEQSKDLAQRTQKRRQELQEKLKQAAAARTTAAQTAAQTAGWSEPASYSFGNTASSQFDPLEQSFQDWETEEDLERLKRNMNR
ncbi:MAG: TIGR04376 family protein [Cyanobacteria bacterium P01_A01_bin.135]